MRFSLRALVLFSIGCGLCLMGLRYPSAAVSSLFSMLWALVLFFGILATIYRRGEMRAYWGGFTLFGCGYALLVMYGMAQSDNHLHPFPAKILLWLYEDLNLLSPSYINERFSHKIGIVATSRNSSLDDYLRIGYASIGLVVALLGGAAGLWITRRNSTAAASS